MSSDFQERCLVRRSERESDAKLNEIISRLGAVSLRWPNTIHSSSTLDLGRRPVPVPLRPEIISALQQGLSLDRGPIRLTRRHSCDEVWTDHMTKGAFVASVVQCTPTCLIRNVTIIATHVPQIDARPLIKLVCAFQPQFLNTDPATNHVNPQANPAGS